MSLFPNFQIPPHYGVNFVSEKNIRTADRILGKVKVEEAASELILKREEGCPLTVAVDELIQRHGLNIEVLQAKIAKKLKSRNRNVRRIERGEQAERLAAAVIGSKLVGQLPDCRLKLDYRTYTGIGFLPGHFDLVILE